MKRSNKFLVGGLWVVTLVSASGCHDTVLENVAIGARDGSLVAVQGILESFFNERFGLEAGDEADESEEEEGGNDLNVQI